MADGLSIRKVIERTSGLPLGADWPDSIGLNKSRGKGLAEQGGS